MGKKKPSFVQRYRTWIFLVGLLALSSILSAGVAGLILHHYSTVTMRDILSSAEQHRVFLQLNQRFPTLSVGIEGNALVVDGKLHDGAQIRRAIAEIAKIIGTDSYLVIHPYYQKMDLLSRQSEAVREGDFDYRPGSRSLLIIDLVRADYGDDPRTVQGTALERTDSVMANRDSEYPLVPPLPPPAPR